MSAPSFLETSPSVLVSDMATQFEATLVRTLYPAQLERLLIQNAA